MLSIVVIVSILLVAFSTAMRTERLASQNFADRDRAEAIGTGMLHRILAEQAAPERNGQPLQPFRVNDGFDGTSPTGLPTERTAEDYYAATGYGVDGPDIPIPEADERQALQPIYQMIPDNQDIFDRTGLLRVSKPRVGTGESAYDARFWAYDGLSDIPRAIPELLPEWVDYHQPDDPQTSDDESAYPLAQVAFVIWDEGGKFDVNLVGQDESVNGIAPHDLEIEKEITDDDGQQLFTHLDNGRGNGKRDRNNFSLRNIVSQFPEFRTGAAGTNDEGDDRRVFSVRELVLRNLIDPDKFNMVTTSSRDFDVRPEWDGERAPLALREEGELLGSESFLRSYINNPALYPLIYGAGGAGPYLVDNTLNNVNLEGRLEDGGGGLRPSPADSDEASADWMQVMRLLAVLRRAMPPYDDAAGVLDNPNVEWPVSTRLALNFWQPYDIWATAQDIAQASVPALDFNLIAYDPGKHKGNPHEDHNARPGIRLSPLIAESALKVKRLENPTLNPQGEKMEFELTLYVKLWNPYPFALTENGEPIRYRLGNFTNKKWPDEDRGVSRAGIWNMQAREARVENITAPPPGEFKVVRFRPVTMTSARFGQGNGELFRIRPYLQFMKYAEDFYVPGGAAGSGTTPYLSIQLASIYSQNDFKSNGVNQQDELVVNIGYNQVGLSPGQCRWYSFQIDDPRMGSVRRNNIAAPPFLFTQPFPPVVPEHKWSWILYPAQALQGVPIVEDDLALKGASEVPVPADPDMAQAYNGKSLGGVIGFNRNFGINWPGADPVNGVADEETYAKMMATFALPGRPFLNIGELGTVFAYRPWVTLNFANKIIPDSDVLGASVDPPIPDPGHNEALLRPAAILDYFTTVGTPNSIDFENPDDVLLRYMDPGVVNAAKGVAPEADFVDFDPAKKIRYQDKSFLFESLSHTSSVENQVPDGNLRPIHGRINLNTAGWEVLAALLKAPYRMPPSWGLYLNTNFKKKTLVTDPDGSSLPKPGPVTENIDYLVTIQDEDAEAVARAITKPIVNGQSIRPLRMLSDLSQLYDRNPSLMKSLYDTYPQSVISAMIGRLAQFGTVRQQCYTIDMVVRTLNPEAEKKRIAGGNTGRVVTGEVRLQARIFFDTFSRQFFIESMNYR